MQRAAASSPSSRPETPEEHPAKRQKLADHMPRSNSSSDLKAVQAALAADELKRQEALDRQAVEAGDTKWILNFTEAPNYTSASELTIISAGYNAVDSRRLPIADSDEVQQENYFSSLPVTGRKTFGNFSTIKEVRLTSPAS